MDAGQGMREDKESRFDIGDLSVKIDHIDWDSDPQN